MALDPVTGNLVFCWYDGRNDPSFKSVQYFAACIPAKKLDKLVNQIPLSNPLYVVPSALGIAPQLEAGDKTRAAITRKSIEKRFRDKLQK
jgi:hypothetical protein